ncbi:DUF2231 domain-containing protein [Luteococcus sp.]|uniref:DUF2231 domain-containing protein n=1 Tax=Luteococcus sp. TaxID=1969402 RepID=UPI00373679AC
MFERADSPLSPLMVRLEQSPVLDRAVDAAQPLMEAISGNPTIKHTLQGRWAGHALHPIAVQVPLGTWMSALLVDLSGTDPEGASAQVLTAVGIASAVPAAITGWAELADADRPRQRVGVVHAGANVIGLGLQGLAMVQRSRGSKVLALATSGASMGILAAAGYLGGHLAVSRGVGSKDQLFEDEAAEATVQARRQA